MENLIWLAPVFAVIALIFAAVKTAKVSKADPGNDRMKEISGSIAEGARAFLFAEYKILIFFVIVLFLLIALKKILLSLLCSISKTAKRVLVQISIIGTICRKQTICTALDYNFYSISHRYCVF